MSKKPTAKYIVLEGIQGTGKTTQAQIIADKLRKLGFAVHVTREPGGADLAARTIRTITQDPTFAINTKTEVLLYNAARAQSLEVIREMIERDVWVICDRNFLTTLAIQYYARKDKNISYDQINAICEFAVGDMHPDLTLIMDIDPKLAAERKGKRYQAERYDNLGLQFTKNMREGFLKEAKKRSLKVIDASEDQTKVSNLLWKEITPLLR